MKDEVDLIISIPIGGLGKSDTFGWYFSVNGCYSVKSGYKVARKLGFKGSIDSSSSLQDLGWWKSLLCMKVPNKIKNLFGELMFLLCRQP